MSRSRVYFLFGLWLVVNLISNDTSNYGAIPIGINIRPDRIILGFLLIGFLAQYRRGGDRGPWITEEKIMLAFAVILTFSCFVYGGAFAPKNRYLSKLTGFSIVPMMLFMIARRTGYDHPSLRVLWKVVFIVAAYLAFTGICEFRGWNLFVFPKYILDPGVGIHFGRVRGPFVQACVMGGALVLVGLWMFWYHFNIARSRFTFLIVFPLLAAVYWTNTRAVWLQLGTSLAVLGIFQNPLRKAIRVLAVIMVVVFFSGVASKFSAYHQSLFTQRQEAVVDRINIYHASWLMFLEKPLMGFGYGNFLKYCENYFVQLEGYALIGQREGQHNTILGLMCETGLVGTIPYCLLYYLFLKTCYKRFRDPDVPLEIRSFALLQFSILSGFVVAMQFSDFGFYPYLNNFAFWLTGMVYAPLKTAEAEGLSESSDSPKEALVSTAES